jgi:TfoX/Sxy family transcriptional regulator of competence genes
MNNGVQPGGMPKPSERAKSDFQGLVPDEPAVTIRPMFGNLAGFVNGNMFTGLFGEDLFVRASDQERATLLKEGGTDFAPMAGRPMKGYVVLPAGWAGRPDATRAWIAVALEKTRALPAKQAKPKAAKAKARG